VCRGVVYYVYVTIIKNPAPLGVPMCAGTCTCRGLALKGTGSSSTVCLDTLSAFAEHRIDVMELELREQISLHRQGAGVVQGTSRAVMQEREHAPPFRATAPLIAHPPTCMWAWWIS